MSLSPPVSIAGEGILDVAVLGKLVLECGGAIVKPFAAGGKGPLIRGLTGFNHAAQHGLWISVIDLDASTECAAAYARSILPRPSRMMCFRVAVREIESWLLADRQNIAEFLSVSLNRVPERPEELLDPKATLFDIARRSRDHSIRSGIPPAPNMTARAGPRYVPLMSNFVADRWDHVAAASRSDSLRRAVVRLEQLIDDAREAGS